MSGTRASLGGLIDRLASVGMPVRVLREGVGFARELHVSPGAGVWNTRTYRMGLDEAITKLLPYIRNDGVAPYFGFSEYYAIDTIYHECTHAWTQFRSESGDAQWTRIEAEAEVYYAGMTLEDGTTVNSGQAERYASEACGGDVGSVASAYWALLENRHKRAHPSTPTEVPGGPKYSPYNYNSPTETDAVTKYKDRLRRAMESGYTYKMGEWSTQISGDRPVPPALKSFCDRVILEGKIRP